MAGLKWELLFWTELILFGCFFKGGFLVLENAQGVSPAHAGAGGAIPLLKLT